MRVAVTGIGVESCIGRDTAGFWDAVRHGRSGLRALPSGVAEHARCQVGGMVDFPGTDLLDAAERRRTPRFQQLHLSAAAQALEDAGLGAKCADHALVTGTSLGGLTEAATLFGQTADGWASTDRLAPLKILSHTPASVAAQVLGIAGPSLTIGTACAASTDAVQTACRLIEQGQADQAVAAGVECWIAPSTLRAFARMGALTRRTAAEAAVASRPFDIARDGLVPAEGAGAVHLEPLRAATDRGARIYGIVVGAFSTCDAYHPTRPAPDGVRAAAAIRGALREAGLEPRDIDQVNMHGTGTRDNDPVEAATVRLALGAHADGVAYSATKSVLGHTLGAGGVLETIATLLSLRAGYAPPIANLTAVDPACGLDPRACRGAPRRMRYALKLSFGFGGHNTVLVLEAAPDVGRGGER